LRRFEFGKVKRFLVLVAVAGLFCIFAMTTTAQARTWFVWINVSTNPATIGVADSSYNVPGWRTLAGPFRNDRDAWREGCRLHRWPQYYSPDVAAGRVRC